MIFERCIEAFSIQLRMVYINDGEYKPKLRVCGLATFGNLKAVSPIFQTQVTRIIRSKFRGHVDTTLEHPGSMLEMLQRSNKSWLLELIQEILFNDLRGSDPVWIEFSPVLSTQITTSLRKITIQQGLEQNMMSQTYVSTELPVDAVTRLELTHGDSLLMGNAQMRRIHIELAQRSVDLYFDILLAGPVNGHRVQCFQELKRSTEPTWSELTVERRVLWTRKSAAS